MSKNAQKIGWIGVGRMGFQMAERLAKADYDISVWNRTRSMAEPLTQYGAKVVDKPVDLAGYRGKVVLVNFWATWCPPCRKEFPSLARVRKRFKSAEFEVLAVNVGEDPDMVFSFTGTTEFPVLFDRDSKAMGAWPVKGLPTTFLVDRQGRLALKAVGGREFDDSEIVAIIKQLLNS